MPTKVEQAAIRAVAIRQMGRLERLINETFPGAIDRAKARVAKEQDEARFEGNPPAWAKRMMRKWAYGRTSRLRWRRSRTATLSSGHCWSGVFSAGRVVITAGSDEADQRVVLVHEIAHERAGSYAGHGPEFYDELVKVAKGEGVLRASAQRAGQGKMVRAAARRMRARGV